MNTPNLLFLYTDEQAFDTLACYGNDWIEMPNLNALASESVVFEKAYVTQPVCTPSRSTLLTGQWPHTNGCIRNNEPLKAETQCLPEMLPEGAYVTGHYGKWHLGDEIFCQHGFDEWANYEDNYVNYYSEGRDRNARTRYHQYLVEQGYVPDVAKRNVFGRGFAARLPEEHGKPCWIADRSIDFIERHGDRPFALYVNFLEPHMPFFGPRDDQYDPDAIDLPANHQALPDESFPAKYIEKSNRKTPEAYPSREERSEKDWRILRARYYGLCSLVDTHAGRILDSLKARGLWDNTIIVFTSDHGDMMGAHGQTAKGVMYEEAVRVPMLIKMPGQKEMKRVKGPMSHIDVMPTIVDLMNPPASEQLEGKSLRPVMESASPRLEEAVVVEWNNAAPNGGSPKNKGEDNDERTVITPDGWKFAWSAEGKHLLFDQNTDPGETTNLYGRPEHTARVNQAVETINLWQEKNNDRIPAITVQGG